MKREKAEAAKALAVKKSLGWSEKMPQFFPPRNEGSYPVPKKPA